MRVRAEVVVLPKSVVNDPQGLAVLQGLAQLGYAEVEDVRVGKTIVLRLESPDLQTARARVVEMCEKLLHNPVIEEYRIDVQPAGVPSETAT